MRRSTLAACSLTSLYLLAGCAPSTPSASAPTAESTSMRSGETPDPEDDVIVSTNEPFWQARSDGDRIVLRGLEGVERHFTGARASMTAGGRRLHASDAEGEIVLVVRRLGCEDDMSGARFPMTAMLGIDGTGPFRGCARPASMPAPLPPSEPEPAPGEDSASVPGDDESGNVEGAGPPPAA